MNSARFTMGPDRTQLENIISRSRTESVAAEPRTVTDVVRHDPDGWSRRIHILAKQELLLSENLIERQLDQNGTFPRPLFAVRPSVPPDRLRIPAPTATAGTPMASALLASVGNWAAE